MTLTASPRRYRIVCMVARNGGLAVLRRLLAHADLEVAAIITHSRRPTFEDPKRAIRTEFAKFQELASAARIPLHVIDYARDASNVTGFVETGIDFLICLSWRYLIPAEALQRVTLAAVNLHRGKLPKYAGNFPVQRALEDGADHATVTAHLMEEVIDSGEILVEHEHPMGLRPGETIPNAVERIKTELESIYPHVAVAAINAVLRGKGLALIAP